jgi:hypothetical protein
MAKIFTKRNAVLGWTAWKVGKGIAKKKAAGAVHAKTKTSKKKKAGKVLAGVAAAVGVTALLKRKRKHDDTPSASGE